MMIMDVHEFVSKTLSLLDKERDAEIEETRFLNESLSAKELQGKGVCLLKLEIKTRRHGMYGRMIVTFEPETKHRGKDVRLELPSNNFSPGDIVGVSLMSALVKEKPAVTGIVSHISSYQISLAFEDSQDVFDLDDDALFRLIKLANDVTYRRLKMTLTDLDKYRGGPSLGLTEILFGSRKISSPVQTLPLEFVNQSLDESQKAAVKFALSQKEMAVIHGPPGTGKTTTVVELIIQAVKQGLKVLATAPSNIAVDNMVEKLANYKQRIVRIGHPARLLGHLQKYSLDAIVNASEEKGLAKDVRSDMEKILKKMKKARAGGERWALREEMKSLQKELYQREKTATSEVLSRADVVLVTLTSAANDGPLKHLKQEHFDLVIVDECSQALEAACWIGLLRGPKCVLAGDHLQLPPTIMSKEAAKEGLDLSLMERVLNTFAKEEDCDVVRMLTTQYRMHSDIMTWASEQLYEGKLMAHDSVAQHLLRDLADVTQSDTTDTSLLLIDTAGCDLYESDLPEDISKGNEGEADIVAAHVKELVESGVKTRDIAVISPYNLQIELLRVRLSNYLPELEVKSVDGFQGREKEAVVISMVRSNKKGEVGFLAERRRINVAVTRARRHLAVVCDTVTVSSNAFIKTLVDYMSDNGVVLSAYQYSEEVNMATNVPSRFTEEPKKSSKSLSKSQKSSKSEALPSKEEKMVKYEKVLQQFKSDDSQECVEFPASLTSHDRLAIHEVAEKLGLYHTSTGEDKSRHIKVSKVKLDVIEGGLPTKPDIVSTAASKSDLNSQLEQLDIKDKVEEKRTHTESSKKSENVEINSSTSTKLNSAIISSDKGSSGQNDADSLSSLASNSNSVSVDVKATKETTAVSSSDKNSCMGETLPCPFCNKDINSTNFDLHQLHCSRQQRQKSSAVEKKTSSHSTASSASSSRQNSAKMGARKKETKPPPPPPEQKKQKEKSVVKVRRAEDVLKKFDEDDFDGMLDTIKKLDSKCAFKKCKTLTTTLGSNCEYCKLRFCLNHMMPEVHGCGDAVKQAARRNIVREGVLYNGMGVPSHKLNPTKKAQLERKMEKKMDELSQKRSRKKKDKDNS